MDLMTARKHLRAWMGSLSPRALMVQHPPRDTGGAAVPGTQGESASVGGWPVRREVVWLNGRRLIVEVRDGTTDRDLVGMILHRRGVYALPRRVEPQVIWDVGANIGIASVYFAAMYPRAEVYCFEPLGDNLELLQRNVASFGSRVNATPVAQPSPRLPNTMACTLTAVPMSPGMPLRCR